MCVRACVRVWCRVSGVAASVDGVGEGFGGRVRGASTASETGVPETAGDVAQQC